MLEFKLGNKKTETLHTGCKCPNCKDVIFSRSNHDYHNCTCGEIAVDGGFEYLRVAYKDVTPERVDLRLFGVTKADLYRDWNTGKNRFGTIKNEKTNKN